jgi:hypothetical protein
MRIYDPNTSTIVFGPVGEDVNDWGGGGINSNEAGRLEEDPSSAVTASDFDDAVDSSFSMPNVWGTPENIQNFAMLRTWYAPPADCNEAIALGYGLKYDFDENCYVNLADFAKFAGSWMDCVKPGDANCFSPWID